MTNLLLVVVAAILLSNVGILGAWAASECQRIDECRCKYADGRGIDLSHMVDISDHYLQATDPVNQDQYFFHPCGDVKYLPDANSSNECTSGDGYALCRKNNETKTYQRLGTIRDSSFRSSENGLYLVFTVNTTAVTTFQLLCLNHDTSYIFVNNQPKTKEPADETNLLLFSSYACLVTIEEITQSSTGKVLLILFFIGTFTYFTIGSIVRFMYLGARGIEVIPNLEFWKDLPSLVRDGARFLQNGCRVERSSPDPDSYDAI